jgi:hypothetical protein
MLFVLWSLVFEWLLVACWVPRQLLLLLLQHC